ncbi:MAG: condensation domain-containing protein, partial [Flavitalea sp.]
MVSKALDLLKSARASGIQISVNLKGELQLKFAKGIQIEPELLQSIKDNKDLITSFLIDNKFKSKQVESYEKELKKADRESIVNIPLSFSQERLWFIDQLEGSLQYHLPTVLRLKGNLNKEALIYALQNVVNRHEVLRSVFREKDGQGYQYIKDIDEWQLFESDGGKFNVDPDRLKEYVDGFIRKPFDLANDYMLRAHLIKLDEQEHLLVVVMHHIASDGWSMSIIVKEVVELYNAYINKTAVRLEPLKLQYADFAIWQRRYLQGDVLAKKMHYWEQKLEGTPALQLPADFQRPAIQSTRGASTSFTIDRALLTKLNELSQQQEATLFMTLLAAFKILLFRYSGQYDISVGTPIAGRQYPEVEGLIGFFINTLVLRNKIKVNSSFIDWLQQVKSSTMEAYENQEVPFEKIVEKVVKERDMSRNPLFQVLFALQNTPEVPELRLGDLTLSTDKISNKSSKLDISFYLSETSQGIQGAVEYCTDLFQKQTVEQLICHYKQLLISIVEAPRERIGILNILSGSE